MKSNLPELNQNYFQKKDYFNKSKHYPVMMDMVVKYWVNKKDGLYIDCTFGIGNHTKHLLNHLSPSAKVIGIDLDYNSEKIGKELEDYDKRFEFKKINFADFENYWKKNKLEKVDGIFFDLGISTVQLKDEDRGFSYEIDSSLDMRIDINNYKSASYILNTYGKKELYNVFKKYGEIKNPRKLVDYIAEYRINNDFTNTSDFLKVVNMFFVKNKFKFQKNPAKLFFQALRIEANNEVENLKKSLNYLSSVLKKGGYALFITFNSLEENIIKEWMGKNCDTIQIPCYCEDIQNQFKFINSSYKSAEKLEVYKNWNSRSSKLWVFQNLK